jgi:uncharacterized BrkB/YihY/UPF0761 family membrane protein
MSVGVALDVVRWPMVALIMVSALVSLYHVIGGRSGRPHLGWGPIVGAALWLLASVLFELYTASFRSYSKTWRHWHRSSSSTSGSGSALCRC